MKIGDQISAIRAETEMTQEEVAKASKLSIEAIGKIERGEVRNPGIETIGRIAKALGKRLVVSFEDVRAA